jgi:hypothetical protein
MKIKPNLTLDYLGGRHHAPRSTSSRHLPDMHLEQFKHSNTNSVGHQHTHSQRSQYRTDQHNRRIHNRSSSSTLATSPIWPVITVAKQLLLLQIKQQLQ